MRFQYGEKMPEKNHFCFLVMIYLYQKIYFFGGILKKVIVFLCSYRLLFCAIGNYCRNNQCCG